MNNGIGSGAIIGQNMIKYPRLREITNVAFKGSDAEKANIFLDLSNILSPLFSEQFNIAAMVHENEIAAGIVNIISHYRNFFWNCYNVETTFHLVWSTNCSKISQLFFKEYNPKYLATAKYSPEKINIIISNMKILQDVISYIPNVSLTLGTFETGVIMYYIMKTLNIKNPNIIITKDIITMQVACHYPQTFIYRPKKSDGEDLSFHISPYGMGMYDFLCDLRSTKRPELINYISPELIGLILSMSRVPERGLKSLVAIPTLLQAIDTAISKNSVLNNYNSNAITFIQGLEGTTKTKLMSNGINERFKAIDLLYQFNCFMNSPERINFVGCINNYDPALLHSLIGKYFNGLEVKL